MLPHFADRKRVGIRVNRIENFEYFGEVALDLSTMSCPVVVSGQNFLYQ